MAGGCIAQAWSVAEVLRAWVENSLKVLKARSTTIGRARLCRADDLWRFQRPAELRPTNSTHEIESQAPPEKSHAPGGRIDKVDLLEPLKFA